MSVFTPNNAGTVRFNSGSKTINGTGTLFKGYRAGSTISIPGVGSMQLAEDPASDTTATGLINWGGATTTFKAFEYHPRNEEGVFSDTFVSLLNELRNGNLQAVAGLTGGVNQVVMFSGPGAMITVPKTDFVSGAHYDVQVANLSGRAAYNGQPQGFVVLVSNVGDGRAAIYSKASNANADWTAPAYVTGQASTVPGPVGVNWRGAYDGGTTYAVNDGVSFNRSSFRKLVNSAAGNAPSSASPPVDNANWAVVAAAGVNGTIGSVGQGAGVVVDASNPAAPIVNAIAFSAPQGRLTLVSGVPVTNADTIGATSIFYEPVLGRFVPVWDGTRYQYRSFSSLSLPLNANSGHSGYHQVDKNFDVFAFLDGATLRIGTGPAWAGNINRGTGSGTTEVLLNEGFYVNANSVSLRFGASSGQVATVAAKGATLLGTVRMTANGVTEDSRVKRFLSNAYNLVDLPVRAPGYASHDYSAAAWRQMGGVFDTKVEYVSSLDGHSLAVDVRAHVVSSGSAARAVQVGIGIDSVVASSSDTQLQGYTNNVFIGYPTAALRSVSASGYHQLIFLEYGAGADTQTWVPTGGRLAGALAN